MNALLNSASRTHRFTATSFTTLAALAGFLATASPRGDFRTVDYFDQWTQSVTSVVYNADGTIDQTLAGSGVGNVLGRYTCETSAHLELAGFNPLTFSAVYAVAGRTASTSVRGGMLTTEFSGYLQVPVDPGFSPLPEPQPFDVTWTATGGTGRFEGATGTGTFAGFGLPDGSFQGSSVGQLTLVRQCERESSRGEGKSKEAESARD